MDNLSGAFGWIVLGEGEFLSFQVSVQHFCEVSDALKDWMSRENGCSRNNSSVSSEIADSGSIDAPRYLSSVTMRDLGQLG